MKLKKDDPRLTQVALGELDPQDVELSEQDRREIDETKAFAAMLQQQLSSEAMPALTPDQVRDLERSFAQSPDPQTSWLKRLFPTSPWSWLSLTAVPIMAIFAGFLWTGQLPQDSMSLQITQSEPQQQQEKKGPHRLLIPTGESPRDSKNFTLVSGSPQVSNGLTRDEVSAVVQANWRELRRCYQHASQLWDKTNQTSLLFVIGPKGQVLTTQFKPQMDARNTYRGCVSKILQGWRFPPPRKQQKARVTLPILVKSVSQPKAP